MPCAGSVGGVLRCRRLHKQSLRRRFPFPWSPQSFHCDARRLRSGRYSIKALDIFNRAMQSCILRAQLRKNAFQIHSPPSTFEGETFRSSLLYFHCEHHPVRHRKQTRPDPRVVSHLQIQRPQSHRIRILVLGIRHRRRSCLHRQTRSYTTLPGLPEAAHEESPNQVQSEDSIFCVTPASVQYRRATAVYSNLTSHAVITPSGGSASPTASALYPVKTPTSSVRSIAQAFTRNCKNAPCSGEICITVP